MWENPSTYAAIAAAVTALLLAGRYLVKFIRWTGEVDAHRNGIRLVLGEMQQDIRELRAEIRAIRADIGRILRRQVPVTVQEDSPLRLSELGERIAAEIGADAWARDAARKLKDRVEGGDPYDLQEFCFEFANHDFKPDGEFLARINHSAYEHGVHRGKVLDVLAIALRDELICQADANPATSLT